MSGRVGERLCVSDMSHNESDMSERVCAVGGV